MPLRYSEYFHKSPFILVRCITHLRPPALVDSSEVLTPLTGGCAVTHIQGDCIVALHKVGSASVIKIVDIR